MAKPTSVLRDGHLIMTFAYYYTELVEKIREGKFREFGEIAKIANIKPREIFPLYGTVYTVHTWSMYQKCITYVHMYVCITYACCCVFNVLWVEVCALLL